MDMKTMKLFSAITCICLSMGAVAQQDMLISQYNFDKSVMNPAAVGEGNFFNSTLMFRKQWVNFDGSPTSGFVNVEGPMKKIHSGIGLMASYDRLGVSERSDIFLSYSYKAKLGEESHLSFGLRGGINILKSRNSSHIYWDDNDPMLQGDVNKVQPNFGFGVYLKAKSFYTGIMIPGLVNYRPESFLSVNGQFQLERHYFMLMGYKVKGGEKLTIEPSLYAKYVPHAPLQIDFNILTSLYDFVGVGLGYRSLGAIVLFTKMQISDHFRLGYSFDITTTNIRHYSAGAHEIMLSYSFHKKGKNPGVPSFIDNPLMK
jgi:type IX secretion system PorP/SprF family membrane protein